MTLYNIINIQSEFIYYHVASKAQLPFSFVFGLNQLLRDISGSYAPLCWAASS